MIPIAPILIGLAVGYVANRVLTPSNEKEKSDAKIRPDDRDGGSGNLDCEQDSASDENNRERLTPVNCVEENDPAKLDPEPPTQDTPDEVSTDRKAISDLRSDQPSGDLPSEQLADVKGTSKPEK